MHLQLLDQLALAGDTVEIADQKDAQQEFRIDRGSARIAVGVLQLLTNEIETDVPVNETKQVVFQEPDLRCESSRTATRNGSVVPS